MALDTGMYQNLKLPQIAGAMDLEEQKQKLIGMGQQRQLQAQQLEAQGMQLEQQRKQQAKSWAMEQALSEVGSDPQKHIDARLKFGDVKGAHEVVDLAAKQQEIKTRYQESLMKMDDYAKGMVQSSLSDMGNSASSALAEIEASPDAGPNIWHDKLDKMIARYAPAEGDSPQLRSFKINMINSLHKEQASVEDPNLSPQQLLQRLQTHVNDAKTHSEWTQETMLAQKTEPDPLLDLKRKKMEADIAATRQTSTLERERERTFGQAREGIDPETGKPALFVTDKQGNVKKLKGVEPKAAAGKGKQDFEGALGIINDAKALLKKAPGGYIGAGANLAAGALGISTEASKAQAQLKALQAALMMRMPRMEGPQSDKDVALYREQAGRIGDPTVPTGDKLAALAVIEKVISRYASQQKAQQQKPQGASSVDDLLKALGH